MNKIKKTKLIVILGPTAVGKTALSVHLSKRFNGEIISADSRQVYKGMDIGSGKISKKEMKAIPHHLLSVANPKRKFSVAKYKKLAKKAIQRIIKNKRIPFLVGGTGFYISSLIDDIQIPRVKPNWALRNNLEKKTTKELFLLLRKKDKQRARNIEKSNRRRLIRALEIVMTTKQPVPLLQKKSQYDLLIIGIKKPSSELKKLIEKRIKQRLKKGMIAEVKNLRRAGISWKRLEEFGLEYKCIAQYLQSKTSYQEMINNIQKESEQYAKRQMTWFKKDKRIHWIDKQKQVEKLVENFLRPQLR